jgi:cytochrome c-type biogenesis protein CcmF
MNVGSTALALAFISNLTALPVYLLWARGHHNLRAAARLFTLVAALGVVLAGAFQMRNLLTHQFQYEYVTNFSDRSLPTLLLVSSFWGGQAGSLLLWATWSVIFALVLIVGLRRSSWEPYVLTPYLLVTLAITGITLASAPFRMLAETPIDGRGLNPLLQNYWMAIHPPILFTGFTTMAGPFAFAVAALWRRDYDGWVRQAQPWTLLAWACLGAGLALGGFWAYESLGWGGFWGWDPVENSSLVPWLFASALLHGLILQRARGSFKRGNLALAVFGYLMVVYSTFLTRSGLFGQASVHSFVELGLLNYLIVYIVTFALLGFGLLFWRWRDIGRRILYRHVLSREFGLLIGITLFIVVSLIVGIGTSMPVISLLPGFASQIIVDLGWYGPVVAPFGLLMLVTMAIGPLLGWQRSKYGSLRSALKWPAILTAIALFASLLLNIIYPLALLFIAGTVFAIATNLVVIRRIWRAGPLKLGGYLAHVGVGLLFVGIIGTSFYKQTAALQLTQDTPQQVFGRQFVFRGMAVPESDPLKRRAVQIEVTDPQRGRTWLAEAPFYNYPKTGQLVQHPAIESGLWSDLYIAVSQYEPARQLAPGLLHLGKETPQELAGYQLTFKQFEVPDREAMLRGDGPVEVKAVLEVTAPDGTQTTVKPALRVEANQDPVSEPVALPGEATAMLVFVDPGSQRVVVKVAGVDLSRVNPDDLKSRVFMEVSREPGIKFAWAGFIIGVLGGLLALLRRWREARPAADVLHTPAPAPTDRPNEPVLQPGVAPIMPTHSEVR